jgi:cell division transport system permease protein
MIRWLYILKLLLRGIYRRPWGSLFTFIAWWFALCQLILVFHTVTIAMQVKMIRGTSGTMIAYLSGSQFSDPAEKIRAKIAAMSGVENVVFIPRQSGLERLKDWLGNDSPLIEGIDSSILPDAFEISVRPSYAGQIDSLVHRLRGIPGIGDVRYDRGILGYIADAYQSILASGAVIALIVVVSLCLLVFLSIRVSIVTRRKEIEVLNLLGAQRSFLYAPYLIEGLVYGIGGAVLALFVTEWAVEYIASQAPILHGILTRLEVREIVVIISSSSFLSLLGAFLAIKQSIDG